MNPAIEDHDDSFDATAAAPQQARELFAHGLLVAAAEEAQSGAQGRDERVTRIIDRVKSERPAQRQATRTRPRILRRWLAAAALVIATTTLVVWQNRAATEAWADKLVDRALTDASTREHVYDVVVSFDHGGRRVATTWEAALGAGLRFHVRLLDGDDLLPPGIEFGSDGKTLWARSRVGEAFELPFHDPGMLPWANFGPELAYYELRPFLEANHGNLDLRLLGFEGEARGQRVVALGGPYERSIQHVRPSFDTEKKQWKSVVKTLVIRGEIRIEVDEASGQLRRFHKTHEATSDSKRDSKRSSHFLWNASMDLVRRAAQDASSRPFDFDPPRIRTHPLLRATMFLDALGRGAAEALRRKRARDSDR